MTFYTNLSLGLSATDGGYSDGMIHKIIQAHKKSQGAYPKLKIYLESLLEEVIVKDVRMLLLYSNRPIFMVTWMGDTHGETNVLPSNGQSEDSRC